MVLSEIIPDFVSLVSELAIAVKANLGARSEVTSQQKEIAVP